MSLRLRLALAGAVAILIALALTALGLSHLFGAHVERRAVAEMTAHLDQVLGGLETGQDGLIMARPPADPRFDQPYGGLYWQIETQDGLTRSRSLWDQVLDLPDDTLGDGGVHVHHLPGPEGASLLVLERSVTLPVRLGGGSARAAVGLEKAELLAARRAFMADLLPYLGLLATALMAAGWMQLSVGLHPLRTLGDRVSALRTGKATRMGDRWPAEVGPVATEIDALLAAREVETTRARARAADLAHGLKTPLQALMGEAARLRSAGAHTQADAIEDTARAMRRTVDRELARARTAARSTDSLASPAKVADSLIAVLRRTPDGARLTWNQTIDRDVRVALHETDLAEAMGALAENAARHAQQTVTLSARLEAGFVHVTIADDGPGIPENQRAALTRRHARADETGTGLGLSIATEIAEAAGGTLTLDDAAPGVAATLKLPHSQE